MRMICENAGKCGNTKCTEKYPHENYGICDLPCISVLKGAYPGSKCIPYIELASKPFDGAPDLLVKETERKMAHVEAITSKPLTDHAKYCRLSKQAGGLCERANGHSLSCIVSIEPLKILAKIYSVDTVCSRPEKQQPVELPKDPLEELIVAEAIKYKITPSYLREFAEKVRAL